MQSALAAIVCLLLLPSVPPEAAPPPAPPSAARAAPERTLQHSGVVSAPADDLWKVLSTAEGWIKAIGVAQAEVDLRLGGVIRSHYDPKGVLGDDATITNTIIAYEPGRMLAIRATAPKNAPDFIKTVCETGWTVLRLEPLTPDRTRLTITGLGFRDGELYDKAYEFFDQGNAWTLKKIQDHFATPGQAARLDEAEKLLFTLSGKWAFSKERPDGQKFSGITDAVLLFDGKFIFASGYLTFGDTTLHHSHFIAGRDPQSGTLRVWNFNEKGDVTEGEARVEEGNKLVVDWATWQRAEAALVDYRVEYTFTKADEFGLRVFGPPGKDGARAQLVDVVYRRVAEPGNAAK